MKNKKHKIVHIDKVYTRGGDSGETSLHPEERVMKDHPRVDAFGTVDELNSLIGLVRCSNQKKTKSHRRDKLEIILKTIQNRLFDLGAELATKPDEKTPHKSVLTEDNVVWLENIMDEMNRELSPLDSFVLPGGGELISFLHQARTVCRRAERRIITLRRQEKIGPWVLPYVNRLSDALFVFGRWVAFQMKELEFLWEPGKEDPGDWNWNKNK